MMLPRHPQDIPPRGRLAMQTLPAPRRLPPPTGPRPLVLVRTALLDAPIQQRLGRGGSGRRERAARLEHQLGRDGDGRCDGRPEAVQVHLAYRSSSLRERRSRDGAPALRETSR